MRFVIVCFALFIPAALEAAVVISEVAWMGSTASANHEWIELYNDGVAVDVSGWTVTDGMNLTIPLSGTIGAQSYAVLERTSDDSAAGSAFLIYAGALVNTGATLQLKRSDGGLEDQVSGGDVWQQIGGDNLTKETAQYTTSGWVTGTPTPGVANSGVRKDSAGAEVTETPGESKTSTNPPSSLQKSLGRSDEAVKLTLPGMTLQLVVGAQKLGYVNQPIDFAVTPSGIGDTLIDSLLYEWNFGDGRTAVAKEPTHSYAYPGTYVVTVYGGYKRQEQVARHEITILPVAISLTTSTQGDLHINNDSPYEIDISGYRVDGGKAFVFPPRSVMLPQQTITLPAREIGVASSAVVTDTAGVVITRKEKPKHTDTPTTPTEPDKQYGARVVETITQSVPSWSVPLVPEAADTLTAALQQYITPNQAEAAERLDAPFVATSTIPHNAWPYLGLIGVIILGLIGTARKFTRNQNE